MNTVVFLVETAGCKGKGWEREEETNKISLHYFHPRWMQGPHCPHIAYLHLALPCLSPHFSGFGAEAQTVAILFVNYKVRNHGDDQKPR